ncbi:MAG: hypothetical protein KKG59_05360, partial [Nanoarchaeota archaeon]|nr:hypothetical protein [Nanoarchaeota archaeon]
MGGRETINKDASSSIQEATKVYHSIKDRERWRRFKSASVVLLATGTLALAAYGVFGNKIKPFFENVLSPSQEYVSPTYEASKPEPTIIFEEPVKKPIIKPKKPIKKPKIVTSNLPTSVSSFVKAEYNNYDYILYANKTDLTMTLYRINSDCNVDKLYTCNISCGKVEGAKERPMDGKTLEGYWDISSGGKSNGFPDVFGDVNLNLNFPKHKTSATISICGTDLEERIRAINNRRNCTNGSITMLNNDINHIYSIICYDLDDTKVIS